MREHPRDRLRAPPSDAPEQPVFIDAVHVAARVVNFAYFPVPLEPLDVILPILQILLSFLNFFLGGLQRFLAWLLPVLRVTGFLPETFAFLPSLRSTRNRLPFKLITTEERVCRFDVVKNLSFLRAGLAQINLGPGKKNRKRCFYLNWGKIIKRNASLIKKYDKKANKTWAWYNNETSHFGNCDI